MRSYQRDALRDFPIGRGDEVLQVAVSFPRKDQPDYII